MVLKVENNYQKKDDRVFCEHQSVFAGFLSVYGMFVDSSGCSHGVRK